MNKEFADNFWQLVSKSNSILIRPHINPDDDATASTLAVYHLIREVNPEKKVEMLATPTISPRLSFLNNFDKIQVVDDIVGRLNDFDLIIFLDGNFDERFSNQTEHLRSYKGETICIDHHPTHNYKFSLSLIDSSATSVAELIYFTLMEGRKIIPVPLAEILLLGLMSDTHRFQYVTPSQTRVYGMAARLVEQGNIDVDIFLSRYSGMSQKAFEVTQEFMRNAEVKEAAGWPKFLSSYISREFIEGGGYSVEEVSEGKDNFTGYLKILTEAKWGFLLYPDADGGIKLSLRSRPDEVNVREIAEQMGVGSGHDLASGGKFTAEAGRPDSLECMERIMDWLKVNKSSKV